MARYDFATHRLFVAPDLSAGAAVPLEPAQMNYLVNVLRMEEGAKLLVFNGRHGEWRAELNKPTRKTAILAVLECCRVQEKPGAIRYAFAPLKTARLEYMIQKAVEMGVARLRPVITQRTQGGRLRDDKLHAHVIEAAEQCGILALPEIEAEQKLPQFLAGIGADELLIFADEDAEIADPVHALRGCIQEKPAGITLLVGPEGGFTEVERAAILRHPNRCRLSLGPRILRADTAAVAALALVQAVLGDWAGKAPDIL